MFKNGKAKIERLLMCAEWQLNKLELDFTRAIYIIRPLFKP